VLSGINLLLAAWVSEGNKVQVLELFFPQDENRNELVQDLLRNMRKTGFEPDYVLFDAWYTAIAKVTGARNLVPVEYRDFPVLPCRQGESRNESQYPEGHPYP